MRESGILMPVSSLPGPYGNGWRKAPERFHKYTTIFACGK